MTSKFIAFAILTFFTTKFALPWLQKVILDEPNSRSSHKLAIPSGGGIFFILFIAIYSLKPIYPPVLICIPLAIVGFIDDLICLKPMIRLFTQMITCLTLIIFSPLNTIILNNQSLIYSILIIATITIISTLIIMINI